MGQGNTARVRRELMSLLAMEAITFSGDLRVG